MDGDQEQNTHVAGQQPLLPSHPPCPVQPVKKKPMLQNQLSQAACVLLQPRAPGKGGSSAPLEPTAPLCHRGDGKWAHGSFLPLRIINMFLAKKAGHHRP